MKTRMWALPLALAGLALAAFISVALAENIDPFNDNSQFAWSENAGWLNAEPANCNNCGVHVNATTLTGYMWGENIGWINLNCQNNGTCGGPAPNWGVTHNAGTGALGGYAWAENAGWISFSCQNNPSTCAGTGNYGVTINTTTGIFSGFAWGENLGWISFSDSSPIAYKVQTDFSTPTPTASPTASPTPSPTASPSPTPSPTPLFTSAMSFRPSLSATLTATPPGGNPDTTTTFSMPTPDAIASNLHADSGDLVPALGTAYVDSSFTIASDAAITNGATVGSATMTSTVGLANGPCNSVLALSIEFREADTSTSDTIAPAGPPSDPLSNLFADNRGANPAEPANGLPDYLDATPSFNNTIFTVSGGGPVTPRARYAGHALIAGTRNLFMQIAVFEPGALIGIPNGGWSTQALGYPTVPIVGDPTGGPITTGGLTDVCSPPNVPILLCGRTDSAPGTAGCQTDVSSQTRLTNPAGPRTVQTIVQAKSRRDHDNDGIENQLDPCPTTNSSAWDPRANFSAADNDGGSGDGLPNDCDPAPGTFNSDQDGDGWQNRIDNCPLVANGTPAAQLDQDIASNQPVPDGGPRSDGIGAACDPNPSSPNGLYRRTAVVYRNCITSNAAVDDTDGDGVCETGPAGTIVDPNDSNANVDGDALNDRTDDCISVANSPPTGVTQTDYDMDGIGDPCDPDVDGDGWTNSGETGAGNIGTDAIDPCADGLSDNAWPPDLDNDGFADISDVSLLTGQFSESVPPAPARHDIAPDTIDSPPGPDNFIDITDISRITGLFGASCGILWGRTTGPP